MRIPFASRVSGEDTPLTAPSLLTISLAPPQFPEEGTVITPNFQRRNCTDSLACFRCFINDHRGTLDICPRHHTGQRMGQGLNIRGPDCCAATPAHWPSSHGWFPPQAVVRPAFPGTFWPQIEDSMPADLAEHHWLRKAPSPPILSPALPGSCFGEEDPEDLRGPMPAPGHHTGMCGCQESSLADFEAGILSSPARVCGSV